MRYTLFLWSVALVACGGDFAGVSGNETPSEAGADGTSDATIRDGGASDAGSPTCPPEEPKGACSGTGGNCTYGCTSCICTGGMWQCVAPGCAAGCNPNPPVDGTSCGGCCGPTVGMTCDYPCADDAGTFQAKCVGTGGVDGTWRVGACAGSAGFVGCGATACDLDAGQACCDTIRNDAGTHACGSLASGSFCFTGAVEECDEKADCPDKDVCCVQFAPQGITASCMPTCVTGLERYQACSTDAECENGGQCALYACPAGESVRTCQKPLRCQ
jgi:hypothetical protein